MGEPGTSGSALRVLREAQGISLRDLSARSGVSHSYIAEIERGEAVPTSRVIRALEEALAASLAEEAS